LEALSGKVSQQAGQGILQPVPGFVAVVQQNDGAGFGMLDHDALTVLSGIVEVKITTDDVHHHHFMGAHNSFGCIALYLAVRRAKKPGVIAGIFYQAALCTQKVLEVNAGIGIPAIEVTVAVVAYAVAFIYGPVHDFGVLLYVFSHYKKSGSGVEFL